MDQAAVLFEAIRRITEAIYDDEDVRPHGSFGWWIFPDGVVEKKLKKQATTE
jgi:hypothetical protein